MKPIDEVDSSGNASWAIVAQFLESIYRLLPEMMDFVSWLLECGVKNLLKKNNIGEAWTFHMKKTMQHYFLEMQPTTDIKDDTTYWVAYGGD